MSAVDGLERDMRAVLLVLVMVVVVVGCAVAAGWLLPVDSVLWPTSLLIGLTAGQTRGRVWALVGGLAGAVLFLLVLPIRISGYSVFDDAALGDLMEAVWRGWFGWSWWQVVAYSTVFSVCGNLAFRPSADAPAGLVFFARSLLGFIVILGVVGTVIAIVH